MNNTCEFKTKWPITLLELLGREWHAKFYVDRVVRGERVYKAEVEQAARQALSYDY